MKEQQKELLNGETRVHEVRKTKVLSTVLGQLKTFKGNTKHTSEGSLET